MRTDTISSSSHRELPKCGSRGFSRPRGARACIGILRPHPSPDGYSGSARARRRHPRPSACAKPAGSGSPSGHSRGRGAQSFCIDGRLATNERTNERTTGEQRTHDDWTTSGDEEGRVWTRGRARVVIQSRRHAGRTLSSEPANRAPWTANPRTSTQGPPTRAQQTPAGSRKQSARGLWRARDGRSPVNDVRRATDGGRRTANRESRTGERNRAQ